MSKEYTKPPTKKTPKKSTVGKDIKDFFMDVGKNQLVASGLDFVNDKVDKVGKLGGKSKGLLETGYDVYNVLKSLNDGKAGAASVNMLGSLLPGVSGKAIEEGLSKIIPTELLNGTEESRFRMKAVQDGYRGSYDDLTKKFKESKNKKEKFAFGGTAMNVATPSEELAKAQRVSQQAHFGAMSDSTVAGLKGIGNMFINTGMSMASQGMAQSGGGDSKFGQFLSKNMGSINSLVGAAQTASTFATGGVTGDPTLRPNGTKKGKGFYGPLKTSTGKDMTEYSIGVEWDGAEHLLPTIVPGLSLKDKNYLLLNDGFGNDEKINKGITDNAIRYAQLRQKEGQPLFATEKEEGRLKFALGGITGKVPINAEGGEVIETPGGQPQELQGPSHSQGGIDMQIPSGTEIYSDRLIGTDGKTMADRKKLREKQISKIEKLLQKNPNDSALKKTLEKIKQNNDFLDKQDLSQMQFVKDLVDHTNKFAFGGYAGNPRPGFNKKNVFYPNMFMDPELMDKINNIGALDTNVGTKFKIDPNTEKKLIEANRSDLNINSEDGVVPIDFGKDAPDNNYYFNKATGSKGKFGMYQQVDDNDNPIGAPVKSISNTENSKFSLDNYLDGMTTGDIIGMGANLFGANAQMKNTLANRNATPLEQNAFKNYGDQALKKIQSQYGYINSVRDEQLGDAELSRQGTINRNNNSARSINTQRALNLATDSSMNELKAGIYNQYASNVMGITKEEAAQMGRNDQMRMTGEEKRAERELQNTDNFFSNMAKNISDKYRGIGETGKALNETKQRKTTNEILKSLNPNFEYDPYTGKLITKKTETLETEKAKDADIKRQGVTKGTSSKDIYTKDGKVDETKITDKMWKNRFSSKEEAIKFYTEHKDDKYRDAALPKEIYTEYKRWKDPNGEVFKTKEDYDNAIKYGHKLELNTQVKGNKHLSTKNFTNTDNTNLQSVMKNLNIDTLDLDNQDSIRALQKALGMKASDIAAGKFGQKTLLAIKKYLEKNK